MTIWMPEIEPKIFRKFKVSANVTLFSFSDKIVLPIMGWVRNYHGYVFTDQKDGSVFGNKEGQFIDYMHLDSHGVFDMIDDTKFKLCDVFQKKGDSFRFTYDLGDLWEHFIVLDEIVPAEKSDGKVVVMEGANACPPEDSNGLENKGNGSYGDALKKKKINLSEASQALNVAPKRFSPTSFSLDQTQRRVLEALDSPSSSGVGKSFNHHFSPFSGNSSGDSIGRSVKKDQKFVSVPVGGNTFMEEVVNTGKDPIKSNRLCANCGSPNNLKNCSQCKISKYCSRECQKQHWSVQKQN